MVPYKYQTFGKVVMLLIFVVTMALIYVPWQQNVVGIGTVSVFSPNERPQTINTQIDGRVKKIFVNEGDNVTKGQPILELSELNPKYLDKEQINRFKLKRKALQNKKHATLYAIKSLESQLGSLSKIPDSVIPSAKLKVKQAKNKIQIAYQNYETAHLNLARIKSLYSKGLRSKRDLELAQLAFTKAEAEVDMAKQSIGMAEYKQDQVSAEIFARIQKVQSTLAEKHEKLAEIETDILKLDIEISNLEIRAEQRRIIAPISGQITRLFAIGEASTVKAGEQVAIIVPRTKDQAVELYVRDFDVPLLDVGRPVRLQFSGWPVIQFSGWPSASFGTFGGVVAVIDAVHDGTNKFRVIIRPDQRRIETYEDKPWPKYPLLRPGAQVKGWIMLDTVSLGFEIWRQINGFPAQFPKSHKQASKFITKKRK